jgi:hypothetical protein
MARIKIEFCEFRGKNHDQPRYKPTPGHAKLGLKARPLRHADGRWFSAEEVRRFIETEIEPEVARRTALRNAGRRIRPRATLRLMSVGEMLEAYADTKEKDGNPANTVRDYRQKTRALQSFDLDIYASPAEAVSKMVAFDLYERMRRGRGLATANAVMRIMSAAYTYHMLRGRVKMPHGNPCSNMRRKSLPPRVRAGSPAEMAQLIRAARLLQRPMVAIAIELGLWTGQRQNDRLQLIDAGETETRIRLRQSKTGRLVSIPKSPQVLAALAESRTIRQAMAQRNDRHVISTTLVVNDNTGRVYNCHTYRHDFSDVREAAAGGIKDDAGAWLLKPMRSLADFRDQDLRDTAVTWLVRSGCDVLEVASITGHDRDTVNAILKHYLADHPERADAAIQKMLAWFDEQPFENMG